MAGERLKDLGFDVKTKTLALPFGHQLYSVLCGDSTLDAYSSYNSYLRRLSSFVRAVEGEITLDSTTN